MGRRYKLTKKAETDIIGIYLEGLARFGPAKADQYLTELNDLFELIALNPKMARERFELSPPMRIHPYKSHVVIYLIVDDDILIVRIRYGHEDWDHETL